MSFQRIALLLVLLFPLRSFGAEPILKPGDLLAICGDSITQQQQYSVLIEDYLLMCQPQLQIRSMQFGWDGETSWAFLARMDNDVLRFRPTIATTCYGMNDAGYAPLAEDRANQYRQAMSNVVKKFKDSGTRVVVGSPGCVDSFTFRKNPEQAVMYNKALRQLRDVAKAVAQEQGVGFADVYDPMIDVMAKLKTKLGQEYPLAGSDGVHPALNGHLVMAYAFLKALGCDGEIGMITVDVAASKASATDGHVVKSFENGALTIESSRYPFCFLGDPKSPDSTRGVIEFLPFNDDLNRFKLVVTGGNSDRYKITWGETSREFSASDLSEGINLAAQFLDNPFCDAFKKVEYAIRNQQYFEMPMIKSMLHNMPGYKALLPEDNAKFDQICDDAAKKDVELARAARDTARPVTHVIKIEPVK